MAAKNQPVRAAPNYGLWFPQTWSDYARAWVEIPSSGFDNEARAISFAHDWLGQDPEGTS